MASASLAAQYRPQTFADVVGQDMVKSILSRASLEDRVAPAYLLSGTRGVGKTTIARIFAKALNCANAPTAEPCNVCDACRRITQGSFVDVVEIDGASNRGIDDVRRLRDAVGYAALEGRYKVFIIDEAHMLTKEAFNALLKTLEEPPPRVTFIMATTEQHKFPVTIISRCQHFVFRQISEARLEEHLVSILQKEGRPFEPEAAKLIARRAAGSVRDSMSLLGQTLALASPMEGAEGESAPLTADQARSVLGLAGREVLNELMDHISRKDSAGIAVLVRDMLAQGIDMGFFLRELGSLWRNLFLLRQLGAQSTEQDLLRLAASVLPDMPENELKNLASLAGRFSLAYIHAAWQMTLDGQRRILTSLEPASGLELLLLNLAMLPRLLPLQELGELGELGAAPQTPRRDLPLGEPAPETAPAPERVTPPIVPEFDVPPLVMSVAEPAPAPNVSAAPDAARRGGGPGDLRSVPAPSPRAATPSPVSSPTPLDEERISPPSAGSGEEPATPSLSFEAAPVPPAEIVSGAAPALGDMPDGVLRRSPEVVADDVTDSAAAASTAQSPPKAESVPDVLSVDDASALDWQEFLRFNGGKKEKQIPNLQDFSGEILGGVLRLRAGSMTAFERVQAQPTLGKLIAMLEEWAGRPLKPEFLPPDRIIRTSADVQAELEQHPAIQALQQSYGAMILNCYDVDAGNGSNQ